MLRVRARSSRRLKEGRRASPAAAERGNGLASAGWVFGRPCMCVRERPTGHGAFFQSVCVERCSQTRVHHRRRRVASLPDRERKALTEREVHPGECSSQKESSPAIRGQSRPPPPERPRPGPESKANPIRGRRKETKKTPEKKVGARRHPSQVAFRK